MTPYYAVIFTSLRKGNHPEYNRMAQLMENLAQQQPGYKHHESAREEIGITVSYWDSLEAISQWKQQLDHQMAQRLGKSDWYEWYHVRICKVEREYSFGK
ncbi:MAG: antibiotic biosynthesis monooxygenase family protein [Nonlabens sp.]|uniref:antibiotic biosynthesis monooxygenase family protein n=1 Tax=Nonlabens sp. TaxID=1888209 RepID=UPI003EF97C5A